MENRLKEMFEDDPICRRKKMIYVSLYGISDREALDKAVNQAYIRTILYNENKTIEVLMTLGAPVVEYLPSIMKTIGRAEENSTEGKFLEAVAKISQKFIKDKAGNKESILDKLIDFSQCFFVFDDLERCYMPITEVFGYINQKVEHEKCKVLIVANEKECGKIIDQNNELKIMAAQKLLNATTVNDEKEKIKVEDIKKFAEEQFGESSLYHRTREKLIGKTIRYRANLEETVSMIANQVLEKNKIDEYKIKILINASLRAMRDANVYNLRIFQMALAAYMHFKDVMDEILADDDVRDEIIKDVMYAIVREEILGNL